MAITRYLVKDTEEAVAFYLTPSAWVSLRIADPRTFSGAADA